MTTTSQLTEESTSRFVQTPKWRIHYNEAGQGQPIIMIHGGGPGATGWSNFNQNLIPLSEKYRVLALDMPGYGQSDAAEPGTANQPLAVKLLMDELGIDKAAIVGNSSGGAATLGFAVEYTDRISHIVTMGSAPVGGMNLFQPGGGPSEGMKAFWDAYEDPSPENFRRLVKVMVYDDSFVTDELIQARSHAALARKEHLDNMVENRRRQMSGQGALPTGPTVLQRLTRVEVPALIIHGRDDRTTPLETSLQILAALRNSRMLIFNRCGHWAQLEHATEFNGQLDLFLGQNQ